MMEEELNQVWSACSPGNRVLVLVQVVGLVLLS